MKLYDKHDELETRLPIYDQPLSLDYLDLNNTEVDEDGAYIPCKITEPLTYCGVAYAYVLQAALIINLEYNHISMWCKVIYIEAAENIEEECFDVCLEGREQEVIQGLMVRVG